MEFTVRRIAAVDEGLVEAFARLMPQLSPTVRIPSAGELQEVVDNPRAALFAVCCGERIGGVAMLAWYDAPSGRKAWIEDVVVDGALRGQGAGRILLDALLAFARDAGVASVALTSNPSRRAAHGLYAKTGFEKAATTVFVLKNR